MACHKTRWFDRWARKAGVKDRSLAAAVDEMKRGLVDADLGGGLVKKRVARTGQGKSGGFRTLLATNRGDRWIFVFGFAKNDRGNIDSNEEEALKKLAAHLLSLTEEAFAKAELAGELIGVSGDDQDQIGDSRSGE